jgi:hypothetical protein
MTKQQLTEIMIEFIVENGKDEYYYLAELYQALDQYAEENNLIISQADRWI